MVIGSTTYSMAWNVAAWIVGGAMGAVGLLLVLLNFNGIIDWFIKNTRAT